MVLTNRLPFKQQLSFSAYCCDTPEQKYAKQCSDTVGYRIHEFTRTPQERKGALQQFYGRSQCDAGKKDGKQPRGFG